MQSIFHRRQCVEAVFPSAAVWEELPRTVQALDGDESCMRLKPIEDRGERHAVNADRYLPCSCY